MRWESAPTTSTRDGVRAIGELGLRAGSRSSPRPDRREQRAPEFASSSKTPALPPVSDTGSLNVSTTSVGGERSRPRRWPARSSRAGRAPNTPAVRPTRPQRGCLRPRRTPPRASASTRLPSSPAQLRRRSARLVLGGLVVRDPSPSPADSTTATRRGRRLELVVILSFGRDLDPCRLARSHRSGSSGSTASCRRRPRGSGR